MSEVNHSPTPWATETGVHGIICDYNGMIIVDTSGCSYNDLENVNASYIVSCVNSHDALTAENARLKAANAKMKKERDELFRENVRLRSMANGTQDDAFGRLLTFADWWDANYPFSPDEGKFLRKSWAKIVQLQMANAKMREALKKIAMRPATDFVSEFEANVATALAALAAGGGAK